MFNIKHIKVVMILVLLVAFQVFVAPHVSFAQSTTQPITTSSAKDCIAVTLKPDDSCKILKYGVMFIDLLYALGCIVIVIIISNGCFQYSA